MWKVKKIIETIAVFIITMLFICFGISLIEVLKGNILVQEMIPKTGLYFLYTIGYGALEGDAILQNILAMIGIVALALMSTFLTINLFWRMDDVKMDKKILLKDDNLNFKFLNEGKALCDLKATFMLYDKNINKNIMDAKEYYMPILLKKSVWNLDLSLDETFWYKTVQLLLSTTNYELYCMYSFVDTKSGQSSIKFVKFTKDNLFIEDKLLTLEEFYKPVIVSKNNLKPIANEGNISKNKDEVVFEFNKNKDAFVMLFYDFHEKNLNLEKYDKEKTYLEFEVESGNLNLTWELKLTNGEVYRQKFLINGKTKCQVFLKNIPGNLENVREVCFTIFKNNNKTKGNFKISDLKIKTI